MSYRTHVMPGLLVLIGAVAVSACTRNPEKAKQAAMESGDKYFAKADYGEAVVEYRRALQYDARSGPARYKLGRAYLALHDGRNAYAEVIRAADLMPEDVDVQLLAGQVFLLTGQFDGAKQRAAKILAKQPQHVEAQILLGNALAGLKDLDAAISEVEGAIDSDPSRTLSYSNLGLLHLAKGDAAAAEATFKKALEVDPASESAHLGLANFYWSGERFDDAERELKAAVDRNAKSAVANQALATFYISRNRAAEAETPLKAFAELSPVPGPRLTLADYYLLSGRRAEAKTVLEQVAKSKDGFIPATVRIAAIDYADGHPEEANKVLDTARQRDPKNEDAATMKVRFLLNDRKTADALLLAKSVVAGDSKSIAGHYALGLAFAAANAAEEATTEFQEVLRLSPTTVPAQIQLAHLSLARGDAEGAKQFAEQVLRAQPRHGNARLLLAKALANLGRLKAAQDELTALATLAPKSVDVHNALGSVYFASRDLPRARAEFDRALAIDSRSNDALAGLVKIDLAEKKTADAQARVERRMKAEPSNTTVLLIAGKTFDATGNRKQTEAAFRKIVQIDPANMEAYGYLARFYVADKRLDEAAKQFQELARLQTKPVGPLTMTGMLFDLQNKPREAREWYEKALALDPYAAVAANNLAWTYANDGSNLDVALQLARTAKEQIPNRHEIDDTLGWVYYKKGLWTLAIASFKQSVTSQPENPSYNYHLGLAYARNGDKARARQALEKALKLRTDFEGADEARQVLDSLKG